MFNIITIRLSNNTSAPVWRGRRHLAPGCTRQSGSSLIVALVFLVILTMLGITSLQLAGMEEKMTGNTRDRSVAFQAAEAALRDAERDIKCEMIDGKTSTTPRPFGCISGMTGADSVCTNGLCCNVSGLVCVEPATPVHLNPALSLSDVPSIKYGTYTGADAPAYKLKVGTVSLPTQPHYLIEPFVKNLSNFYRITARGYGLNPNTMVTLQEIYKE